MSGFSGGFALLGYPKRLWMGSWVLGFLQRPGFEQTCAQTVIKAMKICCLVNMFANFYMQNESRQHPQYGETAFEIPCIGKCLHTLTNIYTRFCLGQPSPKANNYKQLSFLDPLLFQFQISKALSELVTTRHTHIHIHKHTNTRTHTPIYSLTKNMSCPWEHTLVKMSPHG